MQIGERASTTRRFSPAELADFAALSGAALVGDTLPDALIGGLFSCLLGTRLPGAGTGWLRQELYHHAQARSDELLQVEVEVIGLRPAKGLADLMCRCSGEDGRLLCSGKALMIL